MTDTDHIISDEELLTLERRWQAATPGPWKAHVEGRDFLGGSSIIETSKRDLELFNGSAEDYDFVAGAYQDVPRLIAEVRRYRRLFSLLSTSK